MRKFNAQPVLAATALALLPFGVVQTPALAQEVVLEEIIVTARKREENLFDIPVAITAITEEQIENFGLSHLQDIAKIVPGLTFDRSVTQNDYAPALRGLQAEQGRNSVGLLIDDIDISSQNVQVAGGGTLARLRLVDIERIEVVKGPQAALYGRSAFGGAVNYITKRPSLTESSLKAGFEVHSESGQEITVSGGAPLVEDSLGVRINAYYFDERGSYKNTVSDDYVGGGDGMGISAAFLLQASENFSVYGRVEYSDESYAPQAAFVINGNTDANLDAGAQAVITGNPATTRIFSGPLVDGPIGFDINHRTGEDYKGMDAEYFRATVIADWDAGSFGLKSLTSWVDSHDDIFQDNDFVSGSVNGMVRGAFQETERINDTVQLSQEVRISSQTESRFQWLLGALYWREDVDQFGSNDTGLALGGPIFDSDVAAFYDSRDGEGRHISRYTDHTSVFAWSEYAISEQLFVSAEVRYTDEEIQHILDFDPPFNFFFGVISLGGATPPILSSFGAVTGYHSETIMEKYTIPRVALSYRPDENLNLYGAIGKGVKPSGFQDGAVFSLDRPFDRETLWSYEVGAKALLMGGALAFNTAAFYQDYTDQQVSSQIFNEEAQQLQPVIENAGKSTIWGLEFEANWRASEELTLSGAYTYINGEFNSFRVISTSASRIGESGCGEFLPYARPACLLIKDGNQPADLPEHQFNLNGNYTASLTGNWDWFVDLSARYTSERFVSSANVATQPEYWRVDGQLGVRSESLRAALYVDNLLDDDTVTDGNLYVDFFNGFAPSGFGYRPIPLTVGLRVSYSM